jgi:protein associated with RNAse G/E
MTGDVVTVLARKYDGNVRRHWSGALASSSGSLITVLATFSETVEHNDIGTIPAGTVSFEHFWTDRWYNVFRFSDPDGSERAIYANIAMPARFDGTTIDYVDLDIDVIRWPDGRVEVLDRDDFERNSARFGYPDDVILAAETALSELLALTEQREFPFN